MFNNKTVFITGGTGSFGKKFVEVIISKYKPKKIIVFSRDEMKQYEMHKKYNQKFMRYFIGDVRDKNRLLKATKNVDIIVHAAAMKIVPTAEYNPLECIKTNINGAENIIDCAIENDVPRIIALSTDKAANPINLYGATKLVSDKLFIAANNITGNQKNKFSVVRYGNVFGSRGSVLPYFLELKNKKSNFFPITDRNMTRFIISLEQGVNFVIKSFYRMRGGEIFVPKLPSLKITDLARAISSKMKIKYTKIRPGEKIHETMCPEDDAHLTIEFKDHFVITPSINLSFPSSKYFNNKLNEKGKSVKNGFSYNSQNNKSFLTKTEIKDLIQTDYEK